MHRTTLRQVALACAVVGLVLGGAAVGPVAGDELLTIDADHGLASGQAVATFEEEEQVSTQFDRINGSLTIAEEHDAAGLSGFHSDIDTVYVRFQYNETLPRSVRLYVPAGYWYPHTTDGLEAENSNLTLDMEPTADGRYTALRVRFTGRTDATFAISKEAATVFALRDTTRSATENVTGIQLPSIGSTGPRWQRLPDDALAANNTTVAIDTQGGPLMVQYDAASEQGADQWIAVPSCTSGSETPVCTFERAGEDDRLYLLSKAAEPPPVRYARSDDPLAGLKARVNDLQEVPGRFADRLNLDFSIDIDNPLDGVFD